MPPQRIEWTSRIELPSFEHVHDVLHAFLRTSEWGEWESDSESPSDGFVRNYRRGRWKRTFSGTLAPARFAKLEPKTLAMRLLVTLRPSPQDVSISLSHRAFFPAGGLLSTKATQLCAQYVKSEVNALAAYLAKAYQLAEVSVDFGENLLDHDPSAQAHDCVSADRELPASVAIFVLLAALAILALVLAIA
jgi:hypothetical protein